MAGSHCNNEALLAYLDGELHVAAAWRVRRHLRSCWDCRRRMAELEEQIYAVGKAIREQPFPSARVECARRRFVAWERSCGISFPSRFKVFPRFSLAMGLPLLVIAIVVSAWRLALEPDPEAILARARQMERDATERGQAVRRQSLLIQVQAGPSPAHSQDWRVEVFADRAARRFAARWTDARGGLQHALWCTAGNQIYRYERGRLRPATHVVTAPLLERLGAAGLDGVSLERTLVEWIFSREWTPVSLAGEIKEFVDRTGLRLRARKSAATDGTRLICLELESRRGARSLYITLMLELPDYHPRSEIIRLEEAGVRSTIYLVPGHTEWISAEKVHASWFEPDVPVLLPHPSSPAQVRRTTGQLQLSPAPQEAVLLATEVHALYALHEERACLGEPVQVRRVAGNMVEIFGLASSEQKKQAILARLAPLKFTGAIAVRLETVEEALNHRGDAPAASDVAKDAIEQKISSGASPIQEVLASYFRSRGKASSQEEVARRVVDFSNRAITLAEAAWAEAWALRRLDEQFPTIRLAQLDPSLRHILLKMAVDHMAGLRRSLELARELWQELLAGHAPVERLPSMVASEDGLKDSLFSDVRHYHSLVHTLVAGAGSPPASAQQALIRLATVLSQAESTVRRLEQAAEVVSGAPVMANRR